MPRKLHPDQISDDEKDFILGDHTNMNSPYFEDQAEEDCTMCHGEGGWVNEPDEDNQKATWTKCPNGCEGE